MKKFIPIFITVVVCLVIGFGSGYQYAVYKVQSAFQQVFKPVSQMNNQQNQDNTAPSPDLKVVNYKVGDKLTDGKLFDFSIAGARITNTISSTYGSPQTTSGKFLILQIQATSKLEQNFTFSPDDYFFITDDKKRLFKTYSKTIGNIDNYMNFKDMPPSITQSGVLVYKVPADDTVFTLLTKGNSNIDAIQIQPVIANQKKYLSFLFLDRLHSCPA